MRPFALFAFFFVSSVALGFDAQVVKRGSFELVINPIPNAAHTTIDLHFLAGALSTECELYHAAHIVEHAVFFGSNDGDYRANMDWLDTHTVSFNAKTNFTSTVYTASVIPKHTFSVAQALLRWTMEPPSAEALGKAINEVENETGTWGGRSLKLNDRAKAIFRVADQESAQCDYVIGPREVPNNALWEFHQAHYKEGRARLILSGNVGSVDFESLLQLQAPMDSSSGASVILSVETEGLQVLREGRNHRYTLLFPIQMRPEALPTSILAGFYLEQFLYRELGIKSSIDYAPKLTIMAEDALPYFALEGVISPGVEGGITAVQNTITRAIEMPADVHFLVDNAVQRLKELYNSNPARSELLNIRWTSAAGNYQDRIEWSKIDRKDVQEALRGPAVLLLPRAEQHKSLFSYAWVVAVIALLVGMLAHSRKKKAPPLNKK